MDVLAASNEAEAEVDTGTEIDFTIRNEQPNTMVVGSTESPEEE
jgi:hypothetical protein